MGQLRWPFVAAEGCSRPRRPAPPIHDPLRHLRNRGQEAADRDVRAQRLRCRPEHRGDHSQSLGARLRVRVFGPLRPGVENGSGAARTGTQGLRSHQHRQLRLRGLCLPSRRDRCGLASRGRTPGGVTRGRCSRGTNVWQRPRLNIPK